MTILLICTVQEPHLWLRLLQPGNKVIKLLKVM